ncbi:MAG: hypothetical protein AB9869_05775 [Verrucomicrobiia bacterium]
MPVKSRGGGVSYISALGSLVIVIEIGILVVKRGEKTGPARPEDYDTNNDDDYEGNRER